MLKDNLKCKETNGIKLVRMKELDMQLNVKLQMENQFKMN